jgi:prevent-host-death family protein
METFTIRDLRERTGDLIRSAEAGKLSMITKHGQPVFVAVPVDESLVRSGVTLALAAKLFAEKGLTLAQAAKLAKVPLEVFAKEVSQLGIPVVNYSARELSEELGRLTA